MVVVDCLVDGGPIPVSRGSDPRKVLSNQWVRIHSVTLSGSVFVINM